MSPTRSAARPLRVLTQNLYLGADLGPAMTAATPTAFVAAVAEIHAGVLATDFPRRARAVAEILATERPALVGLQEVALWSVGRAEQRPAHRQDFLAVLLAALADRGLHYRVAALSRNALVGPVPLDADRLVRLRDRDVVLVDADEPGLVVRAGHGGRYVHQETLRPALGSPVRLDRGWAGVDATYDGRQVRFLTTHLELGLFEATQVAQVRELLTGPAAVAGAVVLTGDFNAVPGSAAYDDLVSACSDAWCVNGDDPGPTCGRDGALADPRSRLDTRLDLVLTLGAARASAAHLVGATPLRGPGPGPVWASDHAGVVATVELA